MPEGNGSAPKESGLPADSQAIPDNTTPAPASNGAVPSSTATAAGLGVPPGTHPSTSSTAEAPTPSTNATAPSSNGAIAGNTAAAEITPVPPVTQSVAFAAPKKPEAAVQPSGSDSSLNKESKPKTQEKKLDVVEHMMTIEELQKKYSVSVDTAKAAASAGLSSADAAKRLQENGPNQLSPPKKKHPIVQFLGYLCGLFNVMLLVSGILAYIMLGIDPVGNKQNTYIGAVLIGVAFMNAFIEFYQVQKSAAILESFLNLIPAKCYAVRDGKVAQISALELVLGDVVYVRSGDKVPADLVIFSSNELKVDNSSLTGEADPQERTPRNRHQNPLEATNMCFNGTLAVNGEGYGIVVRTGDNTVIGQIASLTANEQRRDSPLSQEIERFVKGIAAVAAVVALIFFIIALTVKHLSISYAINFAIGLPATVTVLLTIAAKRMATRNVLVKDLQGVETLGAITLLATDKTGTLTRNQMTVTYIWTGGKRYYAQQISGEAEEEALPLDLEAAGPKEILYMSALCSRARFESNEGPIPQRPVLGDATEAGLLRNAAQKIPNFDGLYDAYPKVLEIPFNSDNKWAMTIHKKKHATGDLMLYLKGAPERVLRICSTFFDGEKAVPMTEEHKKQFEQTYTFMASKGHRVLAFSALALPRDQFPEDFQFTKDPQNYPSKDLTFYGLVSLEDPPKHGVREAIGHCREAGVKVMMVTGDHPLTAEAIGRKINLMLQDTKERVAAKKGVPISEVAESECNAIVIHGEQIDSLTDDDWDNIFSKEEIIFARTSPKHKLQIVKRAQSHGHIVGVTGDGVNDSPALKKADLGIAMNQSGSDVSKEAAAMILVDDNFASTVAGIEEGRLIFQNLKKSVQYTVTHTMPEVWANLLFILIPIPLPLSSILIILVDLGFEMFMALSYAYDPPETKTGIMKLAPRKPVTEASIARLRKRQTEEAANRPADDPESGEPRRKSAGTKVKDAIVGAIHFWTAPFTAKFWRNAFEPTEEETLVDGNVLSWGYIEGGTLMTIGCLIAYFVAAYHTEGYHVTPADLQTNAATWGTDGDVVLSSGRTLTKDQQLTSWNAGQSAYFVAIAFQQAFNLFVCKARLGYPFGRFMFANKWNFIGIFVGVCFVMAIVYIPPFNIAFMTDYHLSPLIWLIPIANGIVIYLYSIVRTYIKRRRSPVKYSRDVVGLQMYPTRWSTRG
ncbi:hypothetical protein HK104_010251 [Borealophlyctis nickersoniae]|nr:hypothetical protein HK104_010251 [Borealophlyctis nickersoniae]